MGDFAPLSFRSGRLDFSRPYVVAILNVTPDSFSDGGRHETVDSAVLFGLRCVKLGADWLDVGGESTRPNVTMPVSEAEQIRRVVPVIEALAGRANVPISVDTTSAEVAQRALAAGAEIVNDISGGRFDSDMLGLVDKRKAVYVLGHVRGGDIAATHASETSAPGLDEVAGELAEQLGKLSAVARARTIVDPGLGFGKGTSQNLALVRGVGVLRARLGRPVMVGASRKRFLGELCGRSVDERDDATVGASLAAVANGAHFVRVHEVGRMRDALVAFERCRRVPEEAKE